MLQVRTFSPDLNVRRPAMAASAVAYGALIAALAAPFVATLAFGAAAVTLAVWWVWLNRGFLRYARRQWGWRGASVSTAMLYLYFLYCPAGAVLGLTAHILRGGHRSRLNWLELEPLDRAEPEVAVTLAVIANGTEPLTALAGLPPPAPWWELIVVSPSDRTDLPIGARFIKGGSPTASRNEMRELALQMARGEMFATLDAQFVPAAGWLDRVREAGRRSDLVIAGSFEHDRRRIRQRAEQVARYWEWRPERPASWMVDHPPTNAAFRTQVARDLGGFKIGAALVLRMAGFGARPVRFEPAMRVRLTANSGTWEFVRGVGGTTRLRAAASTRYCELGLLNRIVFAGLTPISGPLALLQVIRSAVAEGTADRTFILALPLITVALASHWIGHALGLLNPANRGGMVPYTAEDLGVLPAERPMANAR
jgi:hypothetical protein